MILEVLSLHWERRFTHLYLYNFFFFTCATKKGYFSFSNHMYSSQIVWKIDYYNENFTFSWFPFIKLTVFLLTFIQSWKLSEEEIISLLALCFPIVNLTSSCPFSFGLDIYIVLWNLNKILYLPREPLLNILIDVC